MAEKVRDYPKLAKDIVQFVGGDDNIAQASRCATRLRLILKETPPDAKARVSELPGVITVVESAGQFQVVIGTHVGDVFEQVSEDLDLERNPRGGSSKESLLNRVIATMSAVFAPFVYILAAAGILQGCLIIAGLINPAFEETGTYAVLSFMSWTPFTFLPIFIAITASRHFKCNTFIAVACCAALVNPTWTEMAGTIAEGERINFFGIPLTETTYTSSVLPPLFLVLVLAYLEHFIEKRLPSTVKALFTPFLCILIMVPLTIILIGPVTTWGANAIAGGYNFLYELAPAVAAAVIGFFWQVIVIFGVHWGITPVVLANFANNGHDSFQAFQTAAVIGQVGACIGVLLKTRNSELKQVATGAGITGMFGITEPAIYGVTLRLKKPFILGCVAGAIGAVVISLFGSLYYVYAGLPGPLTIINAHSDANPNSLLGEAIGCAVAFFGAIALVWVVGFDDPVEDLGVSIDDAPPASLLSKEAYHEVIAEASAHTTMVSPLDGRVLPLSAVADPVFAGGTMGDGWRSIRRRTRCGRRSTARSSWSSRRVTLSG